MEENTLSWKKQQKQNLKDTLLQSTLNLFELNGINDTSVEDIVKLTGVAKGTFYLYFSSKNAIISEVLADGISKLEEKALASQEQQSISNSFINLIENFISFYKENKWLIKLFLLNQAFDSEQVDLETRTNLKKRYNAVTLGIIEKLLRKGMLQSIYHETDPLITSKILYGGIKEIVIASVVDGEEIIVKDVVSILEKGIRR